VKARNERHNYDSSFFDEACACLVFEVFKHICYSQAVYGNLLKDVTLLLGIEMARSKMQPRNFSQRYVVLDLLYKELEGAQGRFSFGKVCKTMIEVEEF
jgi:hypothetical protein